MISKRLGGLCAAFGLALGLGACTDDYGYGGLSVGYGNGGYYGDPYYDGYGNGGYGGLANYGWYGDYYYPGTGVYVYDQYRRSFRWNNSQQRYWSDRQRYRGNDWNGQGRWNGFDRRNDQRFDGNRGWQGDWNGSGRGSWQGRRPDGQTFVPRSNGDGGRWNRRGDAQGFTAPNRDSNASQGRTPGASRTFTPGGPRGWQGRGGNGSGGGRRGGQRAD